MRIYDTQTERLLKSQHQDPLLRHLTAELIDLGRRFVPPEASSTAIDIGCGVGRTTMSLAGAGYSVVGIDPEQRAIELATRTLLAVVPKPAGSVAFYVGDALAAPPARWHDRFHLAVCSEVIEHVDEPSLVLRFARDVLRPGGTLLLTTPHDRGQWTAMDDYAGHVTRFGAGEVRDLLAAADFDVLELYTEGFPFQRSVMWGYDRLMRMRGREHDFDEIGDSTAYRAYTRLMPPLLAIDHRLRALGRGTTLVAVARRRVLVVG